MHKDLCNIFIFCLVKVEIITLQSWSLYGRCTIFHVWLNYESCWHCWGVTTEHLCSQNICKLIYLNFLMNKIQFLLAYVHRILDDQSWSWKSWYDESKRQMKKHEKYVYFMYFFFFFKFLSKCKWIFATYIVYSQIQLSSLWTENYS